MNDVENLKNILYKDSSCYFVLASFVAEYGMNSVLLALSEIATEQCVSEFNLHENFPKDRRVYVDVKGKRYILKEQE